MVARSKSDIRKSALGRRDATDPQWRAEASLAVADYSEAVGAAAGDVVSGFFPIRSEIDIRPLMMQLGQRGCQLALPAVVDRETIVFREFVEGAPLIETGFGTMGPDPSAEVLDPTIMLVPLAAFDMNGNRVGYGAGYYDRAIERLRARAMTPVLIGVAFACQRFDAIPAEAHDVPLQAILTEEGLHRF